MATYKLNFNQRQCGDLGEWYEVDSCCWIVDTLPSREKLLVNGWCKDAICGLQFILKYYDERKKKTVELTSKVYNMIEHFKETSASQNWGKFDKEVDKMIMKCLKATNKHPKENLSILRSVLWNKMSEELIKRVKEKEMENENGDNGFFERKNFTAEIYYPSDSHNYKGTHKNLIMKFVGKLNFGTDEYKLHVQYNINPEHNWPLYEGLFVSLCDVDAIDWYLEGPGKSKIDNDRFFASKGKTACTLKYELQKIIGEKYWIRSQQKEEWAADIISKLNGLAIDVFYNWQKKEKYRLNPEKKIYQSVGTKNVTYGPEGCKVDMEVEFTDNSKATITFGFSATDKDRLGLELDFWDIFDKVIILSPDLNINEEVMTLKTFNEDFEDIFKMFENAGQFHIALNTFFTTIAHNWQKKIIDEAKDDARKRHCKMWKELMEKDKEDSLKWFHFNYAFNEPLMTFDSTIWGTATVRVDFLKEKVEDATKAWFISQNNKNKSKDQFGEYLLDFIYGTLTYKCSIPSNPNLIDCKIEEMGRGDFRVEVGKRFCKMSQHGILESLKSDLVKMFWSDDHRLPNDTRKVLNELGATNEQKAKVANEFEMILKTSPFCQAAVNKVADEEIAEDAFAKFVESCEIDLAAGNFHLIDFRVQRFYHQRDLHEWPNAYQITFKRYIPESDFEYFIVNIRLAMKNSRVVDSYNINVTDHFKALGGEMKCKQFTNNTYKCGEEENAFVKEAVHFMGTEIDAKALKKKILNEIHKKYHRNIIWKC